MRQKVWVIIFSIMSAYCYISCSRSNDEKKNADHESIEHSKFESRTEDSILLSDAKFAMYVANFRKGMFECGLNQNLFVCLFDFNIDVLDVQIDSIRVDGDTTWYYPYFYFLGDLQKSCFLQKYRTTCELIKIKGNPYFIPCECGYGHTASSIHYMDSVNRISNVQGLDFNDYPYLLRKDSFERFLNETRDDNRSEFLKKYLKKMKIRAKKE